MRLLPCLAIVATVVAGTQARAYDLVVTELTATPIYSAYEYSTKPEVGDKVSLRCKWQRKMAAGQGLPKKLQDAKVRFLVDGRPIEMTPPEYGIQADGASATWIAIAGTHRVRCEVDYANVLVESNEANNRKEIVIAVSGPQRSGGAGPQSAVQGAIATGAKSKACKATIYTTVQLDPKQFTAIEGVPQANAAKMTLDLVASHGLGNNVHCEYQSIGKDVKLVYTFQCANAHSIGGKHIYACD